MKKAAFIAILLLFAGMAFGQVSADPDHAFYTELSRWETLGLVPVQNQLRPFPLGKVESLLQTVMAGDNAVEAGRASALYSEIFGKPWTAAIDLNANLKLDGAGDGNGKTGGTALSDKEYFTQFGVDGDLQLGGGVSIGYKLDCLAGKDYTSLILPAYVQSPFTLSDAGSIGGGFKGTTECDATIAYEYGNLYAQAGIGHLSFGPFLNDGLAFSNNARHTANFSLSYDNGIFSYNSIMAELAAKGAAGSGYMTPGKTLIIHSFAWNAAPWLNLMFYEASIYGKRFDPAYFIPMVYIVTEGVTGFEEDNIFMGGTMTVRPFSGLTWKVDGFLDDIGFDHISEYNDMRLICSGRTGLEYVPQSQSFSWLRNLRADYTFVTPYMYSHSVDYKDDWFFTTINYQVYDNGGRHLATALEPNSDRVSISASFEPVSGLSISIGGTLVRHGNVNENLTMADQLGYIKMPYNFQKTDGSIDNHNFIPKYTGVDGKTHGRGDSDARFQINFLSQDTIEYTWQTNLNAEYTFRTEAAGTFGLGLDYTFEYIRNKGVGTDIFSRYLKPGETAASNTRASYGEAEVADAIAKWKAGLKDVLNHYLSFKATWRY